MFPKVSKIFHCEKCNYTCSKKSLYDKHILTKKHNTTKLQPKSFHICECGKKYNHRGSLFNHKKSCKTEQSESNMKFESEETNYKDLLLKTMEQMQQQQYEMKAQRNEFMEEIKKKDEIMIDMINKIGNTTNNTNNNFNINMFLNEQCKDAINFSDFIDRIEVSQDDLENNAQLGFVNGITKILMDNLKQLTIQERPIHCTDVKREIMYIKDDYQWQKEKNTIQKKLRDAIQEVSRKSMSSLLSWKSNNPDYEDIDSEFSNKCVTIQQQCLAGVNKDAYYPKVIHNVARGTVLNKEKVKTTEC